jgi:two-component system nitrate/nitrite response regulator NarL
MLGAESGFEVAGSAANTTEAKVALRQARSAPNVVLLDVAQPGAIGSAPEFVDAFPNLRIVAITVPDRESDLIACAEAGLAGFLPSDASLAELVAALQSVARGEALVSPRIAGLLLHRVGTLARDQRVVEHVAPLTQRELEIVGLIDDGFSNKQIAEHLCIELPTVKNHVHHILDKLGVHRRTEAAARLRGRDLQVQTD